VVEILDVATARSSAAMSAKGANPKMSESDRAAKLLRVFMGIS
jgi:hypothetical protein